MAQQNEKRKLATILAVDIAGYSRSTEQDQAHAAGLVAALRARAATLASTEGGRIFNTAGDGVMLEFPTASSGVKAALALVQAAARRTEALPRIRLGLHLGEVIVEGDDLLGHGVNVAARLMALAAPNGLVISEAVKSQLHGEIEARFTPCGRVRLKKMHESVVAFEHIPEATEAQLRWRSMRRPVLALAVALAMTSVIVGGWAFWPRAQGETPFVAVLPFDNISGDADLSYFSDGISTEIQSALAQYQEGLRVAGLATGFRFRGAAKDPGNVRRTIGVTHLIDGSVRRQGNDIRIVAQLIDARTSAVLWTETYDRDLRQTLDTQAHVARRVGQLLTHALPDIAAPPEQMPASALEHYLHAVEQLEDVDFSTPSIDEAVQDLEEATRVAPRFSRAWALLALAYTRQSRRRDEAEQAALIERARTAAQRAQALEPRSALAEAMLGRVEPEWSWQARTQHFGRARELAPNDVRVLYYWEDILTKTGRAHEADNVGRLILQLDPLSIDAQRAVIQRLLDAHDVNGAWAALERLVNQNEHSAILWLDFLSRMEEARDPDRAGRALHEAERHWAAIAHDFSWSQEQSERIRSENRHQVEALERRRYTPADDRRFVQELFDRVTGPGVGQGCVNDAISRMAEFLPDRVWGVVETLYIDRGYVGTTATCSRAVYPARQAGPWPLFERETASLRRDPRIWRTFDAVGLTRYWRQSNIWPDFCSDPHLPYNCRAIAVQRR